MKIILTILLVVIGGWLLTQPEHREAFLGNVGAMFDSSSKNLSLNTLQRDVENKMTIAVAEKSFISFKDSVLTRADSLCVKDGNFKQFMFIIADSICIKRGRRMVLDDVKAKPELNVREAMVKVVLEDDDGFFIGETVWVPYSRIKILEYRHESASF